MNKFIKKNLENKSHWLWIRSADSDNSYHAGYVGSDGYVDIGIVVDDNSVAAISLII